MRNELFRENNCLSLEAMLAYKEQKLAGKADEELVLNHLNECSFCSEAFEGLSAASDPDFIQGVKKAKDLIPRLSAQTSGRAKPATRSIWWSAAAIAFLLIGLYYFTQIPNGNNPGASILVSNELEAIHRPKPRPETTAFQTTPSAVDYPEKDPWAKDRDQEGKTFAGEVFELPEVMPEFPGGITAFNEALQNTVARLKAEEGTRLCGTLELEFLVGSDGKILNPSLKGRTSPRIKQKLSRSLQELPEFTPGKQLGEKVVVRMRLPLTLGNC